MFRECIQISQWKKKSGEREKKGKKRKKKRYSAQDKGGGKKVMECDKEHAGKTMGEGE